MGVYFLISFLGMVRVIPSETSTLTQSAWFSTSTPRTVPCTVSSSMSGTKTRLSLTFACEVLVLRIFGFREASS